MGGKGRVPTVAWVAAIWRVGLCHVCVLCDPTQDIESKFGDQNFIYLS